MSCKGLYTTSSWHLASTTGFEWRGLLLWVTQIRIICYITLTILKQVLQNMDFQCTLSSQKIPQTPDSETLDVIQPHISDLFPWKLCWSVAVLRIPIWVSTIFPTFCQKPRKWACFLAVFWGVWDGMKRCTKSHHTSPESLQARPLLSWGIQCTPCSSTAPSWTTSRSFAMRCSDAQMYCWFANLLVSGRATLNKFCSQFLQLIHECVKDELTNDPMTWLHTIILRKCHDFLDSTHLFWVHFFIQHSISQVAAESSLCLALIFVFVLLSACTAPQPHPYSESLGPFVSQTELETGYCCSWRYGRIHESRTELQMGSMKNIQVIGWKSKQRVWRDGGWMQSQ